jgi:hypothetical protein
MALGTPTLTATTNPAGYVELVATCTDAQTVTIQRYTAAGSVVVRMAKNADITSGVFYISDYEIPQATSYTYIATVSDGTDSATTDEVEVEGINRGGDYIAAVAAPFSGTVINVESFAQEQLRAQADTVTVLGRPDPVVVTFGRTWLNGTLNLISLTDSERQQLQTIFASGRLVMFAPRIGVGYDDVLFLAAGDIDIERVSRVAYEPARRWIVQVQRVAPPPPTASMPVGTTWQERLNEGDTWSYWASNGTFIELAGIG